MPELPPNLRSPFTSSGLNTLLKDASGIRRIAAEFATWRIGGGSDRRS